MRRQSTICHTCLDKSLGTFPSETHIKKGSRFRMIHHVIEDQIRIGRQFCVTKIKTHVRCFSFFMFSFIIALALHYEVTSVCNCNRKQSFILNVYIFLLKKISSEKKVFMDQAGSFVKQIICSRLIENRSLSSVAYLALGSFIGCHAKLTMSAAK